MISRPRVRSRAVDPRRTRRTPWSTSRGPFWVSFSVSSTGLSSRSTSQAAAAALCSPTGWATVVRSKVWASSWSSMPTTETSWGQRSPECRNARSAPKAISSDWQNTAVGCTPRTGQQGGHRQFTAGGREAAVRLPVRPRLDPGRGQGLAIALRPPDRDVEAAGSARCPRRCSRSGGVPRLIRCCTAVRAAARSSIRSQCMPTNGSPIVASGMRSPRRAAISGACSGKPTTTSASTLRRTGNCSKNSARRWSSETTCSTRSYPRPRRVSSMLRSTSAKNQRPA